MRKSKDIYQYRTNHEYFKNYFSANKEEWSKLDSNIRSSGCLNVFKNEATNSIRPKASSFVICLNPKGEKLITRLRLDFSNTQDHSFKHYFSRRS